MGTRAPPVGDADEASQEEEGGDEVKEADDDGGVLEREPRLPRLLALHRSRRRRISPQQKP